ncbi:hypothetical protein [Nocardia sp. alder85J]|uniref:hypothetical protein n=1 Tax=Nocardia sp. alder85J TaxID=2862949 RepID=UPI001CD5EAC6|nr:hypothetical protein [Nocardia sp. alder85J]MCX4098755.1 hypothetical protein [Nocardia sp. alder85J]
MFARSTTIEAQLSAIDAGIAYVRKEVLPALTDIPGCFGLSLLVDRQSGRCIATTAWESEQTMYDSEGLVGVIRARAAHEVFRGRAGIQEWEIAMVHRDHRTRPGACVRVTWGRVDPARFDAAIENYRYRAVPGLEQLEGFGSASLLVDRGSGLGVATETFDSADAMARNRRDAAAMRERSALQSGVEILDVGEFELALAHLRVPELI